MSPNLLPKKRPTRANLHRSLRGAAITAMALAMTLFVADSAFAQAWAGKGRLSGKVVDMEGEPVADAMVTITLDGAGPKAVTSNKKGRWAIAGLAGGMWEVKAEASGYVTRVSTTRVGEFDSGAERSVVESVMEPIGAGATAATGDAVAADPAVEKIQAANELLGQEKWGEARAIFEELLPNLEGERKNAVMRTIAQTHSAEGNVDQAISAVDQALALAPDDADSLNLAARILVAAGREGDAQAYLDRLPQGAAVDPELMLRQGVEAYNNNDLDKAMEAFSSVIASDDKNADAYYYRGLVAMAKQENDVAIADFKKLLELAPGSAKASEAKDFLSYLDP